MEPADFPEVPLSCAPACIVSELTGSSENETTCTKEPKLLLFRLSKGFAMVELHDETVSVLLCRLRNTPPSLPKKMVCGFVARVAIACWSAWTPAIPLHPYACVRL